MKGIKFFGCQIKADMGSFVGNNDGPLKQERYSCVIMCHTKIVERFVLGTVLAFYYKEQEEQSITTY